MQSKPGPRFALVAGTWTRTWSLPSRIAQPSPSAAAMDMTSGVTRVSWTGAPSAVFSAHCGSFSPCPVTVMVIRAPAGTRPCSASISRPATPGGGRRLDEHPDLRREQPVGGEDLVVGDGLDQAAGRVAGLDRLLPRRRVADPDGGGDRLGLGHGVAEDDRRGARRLEAPHGRRAGGRS